MGVILVHITRVLLRYPAINSNLTLHPISLPPRVLIQARVDAIVHKII